MSAVVMGARDGCSALESIRLLWWEWRRSSAVSDCWTQHTDAEASDSRHAANWRAREQTSDSSVSAACRAACFQRASESVRVRTWCLLEKGYSPLCWVLEYSPSLEEQPLHAGTAAKRSQFEDTKAPWRRAKLSVYGILQVFGFLCVTFSKELLWHRLYGVLRTSTPHDDSCRN